MRLGVHWPAILIVGVAVAAGTQMPTMGVRPGSTTQRLVFDVSRPFGRFGVGPQIVGVWPCREPRDVLEDAPALWLLVRDGGEAPAPKTVTYGVLPAGYSLRRPPERLQAAGCYKVGFSRPASTSFVVSADHSVK